MRISTLILMLFFSACGGAPVETRTVENEPASWQRDGNDPVGQRMQELWRRLEGAGLTMDGPSGRGFLTAREQQTEELVVPTGRCATIVAMTSRGIRDLDATLFAPSGDVLAEDVEPDAHPTIQVCASSEGPRRLYYSLNAYDGAGSYLYVAFLGDRHSFVNAATIIGGQPGVVSDGDSQSDQDVRLHELTQGVSRRGFRPLGTPLPVPLVPEQRVRLPLRTEMGTCYTVMALGMPGLDDLNLRVLSDDGQELARDVSPSRDASVQLCAQRAADFAVEVHAAGGQGQARVAFFSGEQSRVGGESGLWLGERQSGRRAEGPVEDATDALVAVATRRGWRRGTSVVGALRSGGAVRRQIALPGGRCSLVLATGGRGIGRLLLRVVDRDGHTLVERGGDSSWAAARVCSDRPMEVNAEIVSRRGEGRFSLTQLTKSPPPDVAGLDAVAGGAVLDALEEAEAAGFTLSDRVTASEPVRSAAVFEGTGCHRVDAVARGRGGRVSLSLRRGSAVVSRQTGPRATVESCEPGSELRLYVEPIEGDGAAEVLRFEKTR
jgi:hypothetical protein